MIVLIESPYSGDIQRNSEYARRAMLHVIEQGHTPIVPHLLYPQVLDDSDPMQREMALEMCRELRDSADEAWFFVDYGISPGMERANEELNFTRTLVGAGSRKFKEVRAVTTEIGQNPEGPSYRKLPIEQQLELERHDRKGAFAALRRAEEKLKFEREKNARAIERISAMVWAMEMWLEHGVPSPLKGLHKRLQRFILDNGGPHE